MRQRMLQLLVGSALIVTIGGHWAVLQCVAWTGMMLQYAEEMPLGEAVARTFDGKHPCKMCIVIQEGKKSEHKSELLKPVSKLLLFLERVSPVLIEQPTPRLLIPYIQDCMSWMAEPSVPPPRDPWHILLA